MNYYDHKAMSYSKLKAFASGSPFQFYARFLAPDRPSQKTTDNMMLGSAFHMLILEPGKFQDTYTQAPDARRGSKAWKDAEQKDKIMLKSNDWEMLHAMRASLLSRPLSQLLFKDGAAEEAIFWNYKGTDFKSKFDYRNPNEKLLIDIKTTIDASPQGFAKEVSKNKYHWQAHLYSKAAASLDGSSYTFIFAAIEKVSPYSVGFYTLSPGDLATAEEEVEKAIDHHNQCCLNNSWPDYGLQITEITLPFQRKK